MKMAGRHEARQYAVQFLFQRDFNRYDIEQAFVDFWSGKDLADEQRLFAEQLIHGVEGKRDEPDGLLKQHAEHWDLHRMGGVDRNVMRVAIFEMLHCLDIPPVVSINEAVDIAKSLSGTESGKFVNGILDHIAKSLDRPARIAVQDRGPINPSPSGKDRG